jgi:hypothetical protein
VSRSRATRVPAVFFLFMGWTPGPRIGAEWAHAGLTLRYVTARFPCTMSVNFPGVGDFQVRGRSSSISFDDRRLSCSSHTRCQPEGTPIRASHGSPNHVEALLGPQVAQRLQKVFAVKASSAQRAHPAASWVRESRREQILALLHLSPNPRKLVLAAQTHSLPAERGHALVLTARLDLN